MRVLTFDPGTRNFAWCVFDGLTFQTGVLSLVKGPPEEVAAALREQILDLVIEHNPDLIAIERYMTRQFGNVQNEIINVAIGVTLTIGLSFSIPVRTITAASWKTSFRRKYGVSSDLVSIEGLAEHECDALGIAAYVTGDVALSVYLGVVAAVSFLEKITSTCAGSLTKKRQKEIASLERRVK